MCVPARECEPLGATDLEEFEPLIELFFTNSIGHSQKTGERKCSWRYGPGREKEQVLHE